MALVDLPDVYLADFGVPVVAANGYAFTAIFDMPDEQGHLGIGTYQGTSYAITAKTADFTAAGIVSGSGTAITVDGVAYTTREPSLQDDGAFTTCPLNKV